MEVTGVMGDRVLVWVDPSVTEKGGIFLPEPSQQTNVWGRVGVAGPDCVDLVKGDRVFVPLTVGTRMNVTGGTGGSTSFIILREGQIPCKEE